MLKNCAYCGIEFKTYAKNQRHCSCKCAGQTSKYKKKNFWSDEEVEFLKKWIGKKPLNLIVRDWNKVVRKKGWQERSKNGLKVKATRLMMIEQGSIKSVDDNWESTHLARLLGVKQDRVRNWRRRGIIAYTKLARNQTSISRKHLKEFAHAYPEELGGIDPRKLRKVLKDSKLVRAIALVANNAPRQGRKITVVRLDTGDVYPSARQAAAALAPEMNCTEISAKSNILRVSKKNTSMKNGMDFYQLDYPVFWIPLDIRDEFNLLAGQVLYELYLDICEVAGYQKQSCLIVAARLAIKITLKAFKIKEYYKYNDPDSPKVRSREAIAEHYREVFINKLKYIYRIESNQLMNKLYYLIEHKTFRMFYAVANGDYLLAKEYCTDFVHYYFQKETENYYKKNFLPTGHQAKGKLENADIWTEIYHSLLHWFSIGKKENKTDKYVSWVWLRCIHFLRDFKLNLSDNHEPEHGRAVSFNQDWASHTPQTNNNESSETIQSLLQTAQEKYDAQTFEQLSMFVALKLEEASDREIADCLEINISAIPRLLKQLQECA